MQFVRRCLCTGILALLVPVSGYAAECESITYWPIPFNPAAAKCIGATCPGGKTCYPLLDGCQCTGRKPWPFGGQRADTAATQEADAGLDQYIEDSFKLLEALE